MRRLAAFVQRLGHRRWFARVGARVLPPLDRAANRVTGGRWMVASVAFPTVLLRCGDAAKPVPLLYARQGEGYLVAATNWGRPHHPKWSSRLLGGCAASIEIGRVVTPVRVQPLSDAEAAAAWSLLLEVWPAFDTYRARAGRDIRVFCLRPV